MAYPTNVAEACFFLVPASRNSELAEFGERAGQGFITKWDVSLGSKPTEEQVTDAVNGVTLVNGLTFTQWQVLSPFLEIRVSAKEIMASLRGDGALMRTVLLMLLDELNLHATRVNSILTAVDNAATLAALKTSVALIADIPQRTAAQLKNAIINKLDAGDGDS